MARAERRNISISDQELSDYLDTKVGNVSAFIQEALRYYINNYVEVKYATAEDLEGIQKEVERLKVILDDTVKMLFK